MLGLLTKSSYRKTQQDFHLLVYVKSAAVVKCLGRAAQHHQTLLTFESGGMLTC